MRIGAIEAGGTKFVCGIGNDKGEVEQRVSFPTREPEATLQDVFAFFDNEQLDAIGIGSFGPLGLDPSRPDYGCVTTTPKPGWSGYPLLHAVKDRYRVPTGWDTDVNAAAVGEAEWGAAKGLDSCIYYTIGTGVGVGVFASGRPVHGLVHPEGGHVLVRRHPADEFAGACPYHGDCLEGMAAGPAIERRWKQKGSELPQDHEAWNMEAYYIGQAIAGAVLLLSPQKVILGGGVMHQRQLFPLIHEEVKRCLNGYVHASAVLEDIANYIVPPGLGDNAGLCGAMALGIAAARGSA